MTGHPPATAAALRPFEFTGSGRGYFRVWIVNVVLTILTLGVFSAWAKVRRLQYFHRHTRLAGAGFDFHGPARAILRGRAIALVLLAAYTAAGWASPALAVTVFILIALVLPWLLARSFRFRLRHTNYRGLRFRFDGSVGQAYWVLLAMPAFSLLSLFAAAPATHQQIKKYQYDNAAYGRTPFRCRVPMSEFYVTYFAAGGLALALGIGLAVTAVLVRRTVEAAGWPITVEGSVTPSGFALLGLLVLAYLVAVEAVRSLVAAHVQNILFTDTQLDGVVFLSDVSPIRLFAIRFTNLLAMTATLGLFRPFAQVRVARYLASCVQVGGLLSPDVYQADDAPDASPLGEETAEMFDFDIGF
jgi:uncharacterized membrane protein YjgN (DUF898 family)